MTKEEMSQQETHPYLKTFLDAQTTRMRAHSQPRLHREAAKIEQEAFALLNKVLWEYAPLAGQAEKGGQ